MATKGTKEAKAPKEAKEKKKAPEGSSKGGKKGDAGKSMLPKGPHAGRALPVPPPRLREYYRATVRG
ncbi:MAG: hypothetical protein ABI877_16890, partial [Gemmatimonadaceae bacterium]